MLFDCYCGDCQTSFSGDTEKDLFKMRLDWDDPYNHDAGFHIIDLGHTGVVCPKCGREIIVNANRGIGDTYYGPFDGKDVISGLGDDVCFLREYQELRHKYSNIKNLQLREGIISTLLNT